MMRLPGVRFHSPATVEAAARILADEGPGAMLLAGGTDLLPNMKRRHQTPATLVSLRRIGTLKRFGPPPAEDSGATARPAGTDARAGLVLGAGLTLNELVAAEAIRQQHTALWQAAAQVATVHLRNMGTLGGNLCL